jgi:hypothetical protein
MAFFDRVIRPNLPKAFFENVGEAVDGAFASAHRRAVGDRQVLATQIPYARGSDRYFAVQRAVMGLACTVGGAETVQRVGPAGYPLPLARFGRFLVATCIADSHKQLRRSKARRVMARLNEALEPAQRDLWGGEPVWTDGSYFGVLLIAKPCRDADQSLPGGVFFGVPSSTLRSWHFYQTPAAVCALYDAAANAEALPTTAKPRLRTIARSKAERNADEAS